MTVTVQNLRTFVSGTEPDTLLAGQLCFNVVDKVVYVGDGSAYKTSFDGSFVAGIPGSGWYAMPMSFNALDNFFLANPTFYGDIPTDNQVLTWSTSLGHPIWSSGGGASGQVYQVTNNQVAVAPGITVSEKIINATGVASPDEGDITIVTGQPGEIYQGLYVFTTEWVRVASYANPTAAQVVYNNSTSGLPAINVQQAVDELNTDVIGATAIANTANATALAAQAVALAALPKAGGTMTGAITFAAGQTFPIAGIQIASASQLGVVQGSLEVLISPAGVMTVRTATTGQSGIVQLNDTTTSTSTTLALTAAQGKNLQDQINALGLAGNVTLAGTLNSATGNLDSVTTDGVAAGFVNGSPLPSPAPGNVDYYVIVTVPASYSPPGGGGPYATANGDWFLSNGTVYQFLGVGDRPAYASTSSAGVIQLATNADTQAGLNAILGVTPASLQSKISDVTNLTSSTTIASSTAVKSAYDLANNAFTTRLPLAGGTMTGAITFVAGQLFPVTGIQDATTAQKGVVQVGSNIGVVGGVISVNQASVSGLGVVQIGNNIDIDISGVISVALATTTNVGVVQAGTNVNVDPSGVISINNASTAQSGVVQLNDTVASTSTTEALTANQGKQLQDQINALVISNNITLGGTIDGSTGLMLTVTVEALAKGFTVGNPMVIASAADEFFTIVTVPGTMTPPGGAAQAVNDGDWWLSDGTNWVYLDVGFSAPYASTTAPGIVQLATNAETQAGVESTHAIVSSSLQSKLSDSTSTASSTTIASSTAVKSAYDLANAAVPKSCYTALGALVTGTGVSTMGTVSIGSTGQFLAANTGCSGGVEWCTLTLACVPCAAYTGKGAILVGTGASTFTALPVGTNGQVLVPNSSCAAGLAWINTGALCLTGYTCGATPFNTAVGVFAGDSITSGSNNTTIGYNAGTALTTGAENTFIGVGAGCTVTTNSNITAVGYLAGGSSGSNGGATGTTAVGWCALQIATGIQNTAVGWRAGGSIQTGQRNTVMGYGALDTNTTGSDNTAIGNCALTAVTTGGTNTAVGSIAAQALTTGSDNVAVGYGALLNATTPSCTIAIGRSALSVTSGCGSVAVGHRAGINTSTGLVTAIGFCALQTITTGTCNTAVGYNAGATYTGSSSTFIGHGAGDVATSGNSNTFVGANAGGAVTTGAGNILIGDTAGDAVTTGSNNTIIGDIAGSAALVGEAIIAAGTTIKFQANANGAWSPDGTNYGTAGQVLTSSGTGAAPTWVTPQNISTTATKATTSGNPINLLSWSGAIRMGTLTVMATDNATNVAWGNVTIASDTGAGSSVVTTSGGTFGTFAVISGGGGETIVEFTPSATLATVNFVYKYTASFGAQPTVL